MANIHENMLELAGNTPLVKINKLNDGRANVFVKLESANPAGSAKDRIAIAMIDDAEKRGVLAPGALIVEPTSGNTGIGLALVAAVRGYKLILTMPDTMSIERRKLLAAYGAQIVLTPGSEGMTGSVRKAQEIINSNPGSFMPGQFDNPANPACHYRTTGVEIWRDTDGKIDAFIAGVGTGGTLSGTGKYLKEQNPQIKIIAVEPADSPLLSKGVAAPHKIQGIGANFIPEALDRTVYDEIFTVSSEDAGKTARSAATLEGMLIGISGGAALFAALEIAKRDEFAGRNICVLIPDSGERYLSSWLFE
ncbi:MAG: cysteine synthase A [Lentisphaeria bacterium]|nr:cysteine synthase A [Lentisphaeria bacterium]